MMFYAKIDKSEVKIEENAYIEFFMKDEQRVVGTAPKDLIKIRLYYKNSDDTVGGSKDVLPFSSDLSAYRQDAGNGWTYCKFPLSLFGTMGASFDRIRFQTYVAFSADEILYLDGLNIGGLSEGGGQEGGETTEVDHSSETLTICDEAIDRLTQSAYLIKATGTAVETVNTYGTSTKGIAWTGYVAYKTAIMLYVNSDHSTATVTADGYVEFFLKNVGRNSSVARESGVTLRLYNCADNVKIDGYTDDVRAYKEKHPGCYQDAGNGWTYYKFPLSLFGTMGATFDRIRFTSNLDAKEGETMYIDGLNIVLGTAGGSEEDPHKEETLTICDESVDRSNKEYRYYANGTVAVETVNTYGNSQTALVWSAVPQGENMMFYVNKDKTAVKITQNGYIEFFIKDEGHTADSTARASGVVLRLYNGSSSVKVDGYQDVKAYKEYNASCRQDAGNGWSYYKLPLSMFGTMGASFDRIRITANVAFDSGEAMYIDGFNFVLGDTNTEVNSHAGETLKIVSDDKDLISVSNIIEGVSAKAFKETENTYNDSEEAVAYKGFKAGEVVTFSVGVKYTITENGYIEVFVKNDGRTSTDATGLSFGLYCDKAKVGTEVKAYKTYNTECKSDAGNGWVKWQIPLSLFGLENGAQFDGIRIRVYALMDSTEAFYLDGLQVVE